MTPLAASGAGASVFTSSTTPLFGHQLGQLGVHGVTASLYLVAVVVVSGASLSDPFGSSPVSLFRNIISPDYLLNADTKSIICYVVDLLMPGICTTSDTTTTLVQLLFGPFSCVSCPPVPKPIGMLSSSSLPSPSPPSLLKVRVMYNVFSQRTAVSLLWPVCGYLSLSLLLCLRGGRDIFLNAPNQYRDVRNR